MIFYWKRWIFYFQIIFCYNPFIYHSIVSSSITTTRCFISWCCLFCCSSHSIKKIPWIMIRLLAKKLVFQEKVRWRGFCLSPLIDQQTSWILPHKATFCWPPIPNHQNLCRGSPGIVISIIIFTWKSRWQMDKLSLVFRGHQHSTTMGLSDYIITSHWSGVWTGLDKTKETTCKLIHSHFEFLNSLIRSVEDD